MSAPVAARTSNSALRAGAVAHRWGGVVGDSITTFLAVGVRCDDEDRTIGDALVVELGPGWIKARAPLPFAVKSVAGSVTAPLFLDEHGGLWSLGENNAPVKRIDDVTAIAGPLALLRDGVVVVVSSAGERVVATSARGIAPGLIVGADSLDLTDDDGGVTRSLPFSAAGDVAACHRHGHDIAVVIGRTVHLIDAATGDVRACAVPTVAGCVARARDRWVLGSAQGGLFALDDDDDRVRPFRPSLRAHQIVRVGDGLVAVSDLAIATSDDGHEWLGRDLASFVRLVERRG